jgi:dimethylamine/trimethylamine dehydrogenase
MDRSARYDILFEPVRIGPVTAKNRFYQVPHCNGMGHLRPNSLAAMRGVKAEGGWAVVCSEETEIHPSSDLSPYAEGRIWDDRDVPALARMTEAVHRHGALAGIQLVHNGIHAPNHSSRVPPIAPSATSVDTYDPLQARAMDKSDIRALRSWHRNAALRAKRAGYDIVYVYAGHSMSLPQHFLSRRINQRGDEYGGSLENRLRLIRELLEDTKEAVGDRCAVALRFAVDELMGADGLSCDGEGRDAVEMLAELPDLWDVNISDWSNDSASARFQPQEGYQERFVGFVKSVTGKPVVGVGRFTSADAMVSQVRRGILDLIGAARPSIADPFLPNKIEQGRLDEIRECIGCNICVSSDNLAIPIRCTQNPTMGEEWRRGWHPERIAAKASDDAVLVVGAGPAGLECALQLAKRGYPVTLAEAGKELGGRVARESRLPGLASWGRVRDYRERQLLRLPKVEIYRDSRLDRDDVLSFGFAHVFLATGAAWRRDGLGRQHRQVLPGLDGVSVLTPDDLMDGEAAEGRVVVYDDDHYYLASVLAEKLRRDGHEVAFVTPAVEVATWTRHTLEQHRIQARLLELGVEIQCARSLAEVRAGEIETACIYSDRRQRLACDSLVLVTERIANDALYRSLRADPAACQVAGLETLRAIGDGYAPGTIAAAVYQGHLAAREFQAGDRSQDIFAREIIAL